jgi:signal transduction histidine kinase
VSLPTSKGRRRFEYGVSAVDDPSTDGDDPLARTVLLRDVTDRRTRQQRLSVLDRSLRHNVRNNLDAVLAYVDLIDDEEVRDRIRDGVTDTLRLSDKAREAEEVMTAVTEPPDVVDVAAVAAAAADEFRSAEYPGEVSVARPDAPRVVTHRSVVRRVLSELIENALVHSDPDPDPDGEPPRVEVTVRAGTDAAAEVVIADNGPGLPEHEREILTAGAETQLHHSRGIGLWFVRWAVTRLGGDLEFDRNEPTGTVVTVRLHDAAA